MSEFTKGKWKYIHNLYQVVSYPENEPVFYDGNATALWHDITGELNIGLDNSEEETHANGRLIAAAPEMYEELIFAMASLRDGDVSAKRRADKIEALLDRIDGKEAEHEPKA